MLWLIKHLLESCHLQSVNGSIKQDWEERCHINIFNVHIITHFQSYFDNVEKLMSKYHTEQQDTFNYGNQWVVEDWLFTCESPALPSSFPLWTTDCRPWSISCTWRQRATVHKHTTVTEHSPVSSKIKMQWQIRHRFISHWDSRHLL